MVEGRRARRPDLSQSSSSSSSREDDSPNIYDSIYSLYSRGLPKSTRGQRGSRQRCIGIAVALATVMSSISLILNLTHFLFPVMKTLGVTESRNQVCLPCNFIRASPDPEQFQLLHQVLEEGTLNCCARSAEQYRVLFDLMMRKKMTGKEEREVETENTKACSNGSSADVQSAHGSSTNAQSTNGSSTNAQPANRGVTNAQSANGGAPNAQPGNGGPSIAQFAHARLISPEDPEAPSMHLVSDDRSTESSGVIVLYDRLVISQEGLYFVYSQIFFENNDPTTAEDDAAQVLSHYVYRFMVGPTEDEILLKWSRTQCWSKGKNSEKHASYVGRVLELRPQDQLYVTASPQRFISSDPNSTFFGVARLGNAS